LSDRLGTSHLPHAQPAAKGSAGRHEHKRGDLRPNRAFAHGAEQRDCGTESQDRGNCNTVGEWATPSKPCGYESPKQREDHAEGDASDHDGHRCGLVRWLPGDLEERECRQRED
jgi:hypothetical protein